METLSEILGETVTILPDDILQAQVCQECFRYLSVGPVTVSARGAVICGRCYEGNTLSLFNMVTDCFLYKCTNHLNGCNKILDPAQMADHELTCPYLPQDCFLCSFSGNLSQILNHFLKIHPKNVSNDGKFSFILSREASYNKATLLLVENNIFLVTVNMTETMFRALIWPMSKIKGSDLNQYKVKFFSPKQPSIYDFVITDFGPVSDRSLSVFEKSIDHLISVFDCDIPVCCQIVVEKFDLDTKALEVQYRYARLRHMEDKLGILENDVRIERQELRQKAELYDHAMNIFKMMSSNLFKCMSCKKICPTDMNYCQKMHAYCKNCLTIICKECDMTRKFTRLVHLEHFKVSCDFPECNVDLTLYDYLGHKPECSKRPYKCPLQDCNEIVLSAKQFIKHWHSEKLEIYCKDLVRFKDYTSEEFYWMLNSDLYHVMIKFEKYSIWVLINEINVLSSKTSFKCLGFRDNKWYKIESSEWCDKFNVCVRREEDDAFIELCIRI